MHAHDAEALVRPLLWIGFDGRIPTPEAARLIHQGVSGVILFARNVGDSLETRTLIRELKAIAPGPLLLSVDQEGGRVARLTEGFTRFPPLRELVAKSPDEVREIGSLLGSEVRGAGFDIDLAPVVDVDSNPANPVIGDRSFSHDPHTVARLGAAMIEGLQRHVAACAKHFPGHGDTDKDSHHDLPRLPHAIDRLRACELVPFHSAVRAGVACVMTTHVVFDALDPGVAATMSAPAIRLLRGEIGFGGVCVSDCLEMKAISEHFGCGNAAVRAVSAGVDAMLVSHTPEAQHEVVAALAAALMDGRLAEARVVEARTRLDRLAHMHARKV